MKKALQNLKLTPVSFEMCKDVVMWQGWWRLGIRTPAGRLCFVTNSPIYEK